MPEILVTGATGKLGRKTVECLLEFVDADRLAVAVRRPDRAADLAAAGVEVRYGDFDVPASLDGAFAAVERLLLVSSSDFDNETRIRQHQAAIDAAARARVRFIAYTSSPRADVAEMSVAAVHKAAELAIRDTGIPFSFLRNNWYLENEVEEVDTVQRVMAGESLVTSAGSARTGWVLREDFASAAAIVLTTHGHENTVYELSGKPKTYDEFATALADVLARPVKVEHVDDAELLRLLEERGTPWAELMVEFQEELRRGVLDVTSGDLERVLGRPPVPLADGLRRLVAALRPDGVDEDAGENRDTD